MVWSWHYDLLCEYLTAVQTAQGDKVDHQRPAPNREVHDRDHLFSVLGLGDRA